MPKGKRKAEAQIDWGAMQIRVNAQEYVEHCPVDSVFPHPKNPRRGDITAIAESIRENGFYGSITVQKSTRYILAGNHRWQVAKQAGAATIPATIIDVDDDEALKILMADNRTAELGGFDEITLNDIFSELSERGTSLSGTGYDAEALESIMLEAASQQLSEQDRATRAEHKAQAKHSAPVIQTTIVFDNERQQEIWQAFVRLLKKLYPECETTASRLEKFISVEIPKRAVEESAA